MQLITVPAAAIVQVTTAGFPCDKLMSVGQHRSAAGTLQPRFRTSSSLAAAGVYVDISTKDWRMQKMTDKVHVLFDRVWSKGEVQLVDDLITDDFVWKV